MMIRLLLVTRLNGVTHPGYTASLFSINSANNKNFYLKRALQNQGFWSIPNDFGVSDHKHGFAKSSSIIVYNRSSLETLSEVVTRLESRDRNG